MYRFSDAGNDEARHELRGRRRKREDVRGLYTLNHIVKQEVDGESWPWFIRKSDLAAIQGRSRHLPKRRRTWATTTKAEVEVISGARWLALHGPADHDELLAVQAFDLAPQATVAGRVRSIGALRNNALDRQRTGLLEEGATVPRLVIAVLQE